MSITPSATPLVTDEAIRRLADAGIHRLAISIDAAAAESHDAVRGVAGSFERSIHILETAKKSGLDTQINTTLTPENVDEIESMANCFAGLGITLWSVFFLVPVGRAAEASRLSAEACEQSFERLWQQSQIQTYAIKTTEAPHYRRYAIQRRKSLENTGPPPHKFTSMGINDGKGIMFVSHAGIVQPSGFLPLTCGLFPLQHVFDIYEQSPIFRALRDSRHLEGKCGKCEYRNVCGGSRARAYAVTGNPFAEEPDCAYLP